MKILKLISDGLTTSAVVMTDDGKPKKMDFPASLGADVIRAKILGTPLPVKPVMKAPESSTVDRSYTAPPEDIRRDNFAKEETTLTRKRMIQELNAAGIRGYQTSPAVDVKKAYDAAVIAGKIKRA